MKNVDPWLIIDLIFLLAALTAIVLSVVFLVWLDRRYGIAAPPEEIRRLQQKIPSGPIPDDLRGYLFDRQRGGRKTYRRGFDTPDGNWDLTVELEGESIVAFSARLKSSRSWLMNTTVQGWCKYPQIIEPDGCG